MTEGFCEECGASAAHEVAEWNESPSMQQQSRRITARNSIFITLLACTAAISEQDLQALLSRIFGSPGSFPDTWPYLDAPRQKMAATPTGSSSEPRPAGPSGSPVPAAVRQLSPSPWT